MEYVKKYKTKTWWAKKNMFLRWEHTHGGIFILNNKCVFVSDTELYLVDRIKYDSKPPYSVWQVQDPVTNMCYGMFYFDSVDDALFFQLTRDAKFLKETRKPDYAHDHIA